MRRLLVTGATGFVGQHALPLLTGRGDEVHAVSSRPVRPEGRSIGAIAADAWLSESGITWHQADLLAPGAAKALVETVEPTHLLHFAWYAEPGRFWASQENLRWVAATLELVEAFVANGGERIVAAGTCAEYDWSAGRLSEATTPMVPATLYGSSKLGLGTQLEALSLERGVSLAWGRIFFVYGPGEHPARLVSSVMRSLLRGEEALCTAGTQRRDFLHVTDLADAFVRLLDSEIAGPVNLGSGEATAVRDVVLAIADRLEARHLVRLGARADSGDEPELIVADVGRLRCELNWKPRYDLESGLAHTLDWHRRQLAKTNEDLP